MLPQGFMTLYMRLEQLAYIPKSMLPVGIFHHLKNLFKLYL